MHVCCEMLKEVLIAGYPGAPKVTEVSTTKGVVSRFMDPKSKMWETDTTLNPGFSGGPVISTLSIFIYLIATDECGLELLKEDKTGETIQLAYLLMRGIFSHLLQTKISHGNYNQIQILSYIFIMHKKEKKRELSARFRSVILYK